MDKEKVLQATQEFAFTFGVAFVLSFAAWVTGWTKLPNLGEAQAAFAAAGTAGSMALAKAVTWYFTGTKVREEAAQPPAEPALVEDR